MKKRLLAWILALLMVVGLVQIPSQAQAASSDYTTCASGTVSWQMIHDNPNTYYWVDADGAYCVLSGIQSGGYYYVTLYRPGKSNGTELRYLRQNKSDDSASKHEWSSASAKYTGGVLYTKGSTTASSYTVTFNYNGHGTNSTQTVAAGGKVSQPSAPTATGYKFLGWYTSSGTAYNFSSAVNSSFTLYAKWEVDASSGEGGSDTGSAVYKGSGTVSFKKDNYDFDVYIYVTDGKIQNITSELTTTPVESKSKTKYQPEAVAAILNLLKGKSATPESVDAISAPTPIYSGRALKTAIYEALGGVAVEKQASITLDTGSITLTTGGTGTKAVSQEGCTLSVTSSNTGVATVSYNNSSNTITVIGVGTGTATITVTGTASDGYTAPTAQSFTVSVSDGSTGVTITNPNKATGNDLELTKTLSYDSGSDSYTITLTGKATKGASSEATYTMDGYNKDYSYSTLQSGTYYYLYNGTYYQVNALSYTDKKSETRYVGYFTVGSTKYYLDKTPQAYSDSQLKKQKAGDTKESKAYSSCKEDKVTDGEKLPLYTKSGGTSSGTTHGTACVLKDTVNTTNFDTSGASISVTPTSATQSFNKSSGLVTVTGYNYTSSYGGTPLTVTISGLKAKKTGNNLASNGGYAGIYANSSASTALVSVSSPTANIPAAATVKEYTLNYNANGGSSAPASQTGNSADSSYTFIISDTQPARSGYSFQGWAESASAATPGYIAGESITVTGAKTLYAVWSENASTGKYIDGTTEVEIYEYTPVVTVVVGADGKFEDIKASADDADGYSLELFQYALERFKTFIIGKDAVSSEVNAYVSKSDIDEVSSATLSGNALKTAVNNALAAKNIITWNDANNTELESVHYTTGTMPFYTGKDLGESFKDWTPELIKVSGDKTYTATYYNMDEYKLTVDDIVIDLSDGYKINGEWMFTPENREQMYAYPIYQFEIGGQTVASHAVGSNHFRTDTYQYSYTSTNEAVAKAFQNSPGAPDLQFSGSSGEATVTMIITDKSTGEELARDSFTVTVNPCTITWNVDGTETRTTANCGEKPQSGLTPIKSGYTFAGWATSADAETGAAEAALPAVTGDTMYYAVFVTAAPSAVEDGKYIDGTQVVLGYNYHPRVKITVENGKIKAVDTTSEDVGNNSTYFNTASEWLKNNLKDKDANEASAEALDAVSGATYTKKALKEAAKKALAAENTITWANDDSTVLDSAKVSTGTTPSYDGEEQPSKENYNFVGWTPEIHVVNGDQTYTAVYEAQTVEYTVSYDLDGGIGTVTDSQKYKAGDIVTVSSAVPTRDGYRFGGWSLDGTKLRDFSFSMPVGNVTLKALWDEWHEDGIYGDASVQDPLNDEKYLIVSVMVEDNRIINVTAEEDEEKEILEYYDEYGIYAGLEYVNEMLLGEEVTAENLERLYYEYNAEYGSDAPLYASYIIDAIRNAVTCDPKPYYTVTILDEDGQELEKYTNIRYGTRFEDVVNTPVKDADENYSYEFKAWNPDSETIITEDAQYTAVFKKTARYTVTWKNADGTVLGTNRVLSGSKPVYSGTEPVKAEDEAYSYTFSGWAADQDATSGIVAANLPAVSGNTEYYAVFSQTKRSYTVTWLNDDGTKLSEDTVAYGETPSYTGDTPQKAGTAQYSYTFAGWTPEINAVTGDASYTATYNSTVNTYKVTWVNDDGTVLKTDEHVAYGIFPQYDGAVPAKAGDARYSYTFASWTPEVTTVTGDITYQAVYTPKTNTYTVKWQNDNGDLLETDEGVAYGETPKYNGKTPVKASDAQYSYTFAGWTPDVDSVIGNIIYTATYTRTLRSYTVTWVNADGKVLEADKDVPYGTIPEYNGDTPERKATAQYSYTFREWSPAISAVDGDVTYTAAYTETTNEYTVTWVDEDGTVLETDTVAYGKTPKYKGQTPVKAGNAKHTYEFDTWTPEVASVTGDVTYKASYKDKINTYTITWKDADGNTLETDEDVPYGTMPTYDGETPKKAATDHYTFTFDKWSPDVAEVTGNTTYTAVFTATKIFYTITWKNEDGTVLKTDENAEYGTTPVYDGETPVKESDGEHYYMFAGWTPEVAAVTEDATYTARFTDGIQSYTVTWQNEDGTVLKTDTEEYGTLPMYTGETPTRDDDEIYSYTFAGWTPVLRVVTGNVVYKATYTRQKTGFRIHLEDYTKGKATVSGIDENAFYRGEVKFTVEAPLATIAAIHDTDSDSYTRLYCTEIEEGKYQFSLNVADADVYLTTVYKGDVNLDGRTNTRDTQIAAQAAGELISLGGLEALAGDVDVNGKTNTRDTQTIAQVAGELMIHKWDLEK